MKALLLTLLLSVSAVAANNCFLEGRYDVEFFPAFNPFWLEGYVGQDRIRLDLTQSFNSNDYEARGWIKGVPVNLNLQIKPNDSFAMLTGRIRSTYIQWQSFGNRFTGYQQCIRN